MRKWLPLLPYGEGKSGQTKVLILEAALEIATQQGLGKLSIAEIARTAHQSKPRVLYHYSDIEQILVDLFQLTGRIGQSITEEIQRNSYSPEERLSASISGAFQWVQNDIRWGRYFLLMYAQSPMSPKIAQIHQTILQKGQERISRELKEKRFKKAQALSQELHSGLVGSLLKMISLQAEDQAQSYANSCHRLFEGLTSLKLPKPKIRL